MPQVNVPRVMSTQHPDNVQMPFFANGEVVAGEDEVKEAYYVFSQLGVTEQMWDGEGKEVDDQVIEKLLSSYGEFFKEKKLGTDLRITYRVPNPSVQKEQGKILLETLHSIPRAFDVARGFSDTPPIFEVILPMTTSVDEIDLIANYYEKIIIGQKNLQIARGKSIKDWVGDFQPEKINVIPLFENKEGILNAANITKEHIQGKNLEYQRVFIARSDPALNYGSVAAVLLNKIAMMDLDNLQEQESVDILPIIGVGGLPFRGNFNPANVSNCMAGYPSVQTFTIQSAFKYDNPYKDVANAVETINRAKRGKAIQIDRTLAVTLIDKLSKAYQEQMLPLSNHINKIASKLPNRRARKTHTGLFGYSRSNGGVTLPRAIKFCGALYSMGLPPEILGLSALTSNELDQVRSIYKNLDLDMSTALHYLNLDVVDKLPESTKNAVKKTAAQFNYETNDDYVDVTSKIYTHLTTGNDALLNEELRRAAWIRKSIG